MADMEKVAVSKADFELLKRLLTSNPGTNKGIPGSLFISAIGKVVLLKY